MGMNRRGTARRMSLMIADPDLRPRHLHSPSSVPPCLCGSPHQKSANSPGRRKQPQRTQRTQRGGPQAFSLRSLRSLRLNRFCLHSLRSFAPFAVEIRNRNRQGREGTRRRSDAGGDEPKNQEPFAVLRALCGSAEMRSGLGIWNSTRKGRRTWMLVLSRFPDSPPNQRSRAWLSGTQEIRNGRRLRILPLSIRFAFTPGRILRRAAGSKV